MAVGGAIGDLGDPMKMMYMATNNVEGIQDALIGATSSLATFNKESGKFEVIGINIRKAKAMADAMGISMSELRKGAIAAAERTSAAMDMLSNGLKLDKDQTDLITNLSHMKDGKMTMEIQGDEMRKILGVKGDVKEIALESLTQTQAEQLAEYQKRESEKTPEDIIRGQATNVELITRDVHYMLKLMTVQGARTLGKGIKEFAKELGIEFDSETLSKDTKNLRNLAADKAKEAFKDVNANIDKYGKVDAAKSQGVPTPTPTPTPVDGNSESKGKTTKVEMNITSNVNEDSLRTNLTNHPTFVDELKNIFRAKGSYTDIEK
jgi:uncharacterized protein with FMN-binding domain